MHVEARPATARDLDRLVELAEAAVDEQRGSRGGLVWAVREARPVPARPSLSDELADPDHLVVVGAIDDAVVGYATAALEVLRDGSRLARIGEIVVEPDARAVGVGEAMLDAVVAWALEHECRGVDALVLPGNREAKNFFESGGLTARAIVVHRVLP